MVFPPSCGSDGRDGLYSLSLAADRHRIRKTSGQSYLYAGHNDGSLSIVLTVLLPTMSTFLKVSGTKLVDGNGKEVILRGAGLGGWMK